MTDPRIETALEKLAPGGWSLTLGGFAAKALKLDRPLSAKDERIARDAMMATGLPHRRVKYGNDMIDCWDLQK